MSVPIYMDAFIINSLEVPAFYMYSMVIKLCTVVSTEHAPGAAAFIAQH